MKKIFLFALSLVFCLSIIAQPQTYKIETLSKPKELLQTVKAENLYDNIEQDLVKISLSGDIVFERTHPVFGGFLKAYKEHRPITISPDIMWLLICQGFAQHVNNNSEKLRHKFVDFKGQKTLTVEREVEDITKIKDFPWDSVFPEFVEQIGAATSKELTDNLAADFTTTTPASMIASQITVMESVKAYFKYKVIMYGCGLPEVTIEGTVEDWEKILSKLDYISQYDLNWWTRELKPVIQEIINTKKGEFKKDFWMDMVRFHREGLYGSLEDIDGWLVKFFPYSNTGERMNLRKIDNISSLPNELVRVPFILEIRYGNGELKETHYMEFWAGFMGLEQNPETFNLKPVIGWAINKTDKKAEDLGDVKEKSSSNLLKLPMITTD